MVFNILVGYGFIFSHFYEIKLINFTLPKEQGHATFIAWHFKSVLDC